MQSVQVIEGKPESERVCNDILKVSTEHAIWAQWSML